MEFFAESLQGPLIEHWSIVLLHFIWQGFVIAGTVSIALRVFTRAQPNVRYGIALCGLPAVIVVVATTFRMTAFGRTEPQSIAAQIVEQPLPSVGGAQFHPSESAMTMEMLNEPEPWRQSELAEHWRVAVVFAWFCGQLAMAMRMIVGWTLLQRLKLRSLEISTELQGLSERLAKRIGLRVAPAVRSSIDLTDAAAFGFLRSVVLLPAAWLTEMPPEMVEAVLAHEFSHVRRHDAWVNLVQRLVESTFFYHPAVWWMSKQIRVERERCRDAEAIRATGRREIFAKTLEYAARHRVGSRIALASNLGDDRMSLLDRINHVLNGRPARQHKSGWQFGIAALFVPAALAWSFPSQLTVAEEQAEQRVGRRDDTRQDDVPPSPAVPSAEVPNVEVALSSFDAAIQQVPSELSRVTLPKYRIGPPDILLIQSVRTVPKSPYRIQSNDFLRIMIPNALTDAPIAGSFQVTRTGTVNLGEKYGTVVVTGKSIDDARAAITESLSRVIKDPQVSVTLLQASGVQQVSGEHIISPDGYVSLGVYGSVYVAGMTTEEARAAMEKHLSEYLDKPRISVDVHVYNSSFFYVITQGIGLGDNLVRIPITGNETVLDAFSQIGGLGQLQGRSIWIARPGANGSADQILPIDWEQITRGANAATNYQVLPGDRIFVSENATGHVLINHKTNIESVVEKFNRLVDQKDYDDAIAVAKRLKKVHPKNSVAVALSKHADLLMEHARIEAGHETAKSFSLAREWADDHNGISKALQKRINVNFDAVPLKPAIQIIASEMGGNIVLDPEGLKRHSISDDVVVTLNLQDVSAKNVLSLILDRFGLIYLPKDGVIFVTSPHLANPVTPRAYDVHDLLNQSMIDSKTGKTRKSTFDDIIELITDTVDPDSWEEVGGEGSIQVFPTNLSIVVSATGDNHESVDGLLKQLRLLNRRQLR